MRSIPLVMTREMLYRGRWSLIACLLVSNILPVLIFSLLRLRGLAADDPSMRMMLFRFMSVSVLFGGISVIDTHAFPRFLNVFPISTIRLVIYQLVPMMLIAGLDVLLVTTFQNWLFTQSFPVWGPALFIVTGVTVCWATFWFTKQASWQPAALLVVAASLLSWYLPRFSMPMDSIEEITPLEGAALTVVTIAFSVTGYIGVARHRCGEGFTPYRAPASVQRIFDRPSTRTASFRTPFEAQVWFEWTSKGWAMPLLVAVGLLAGVITWLTQNGDPQILIHGFIVGGMLLSFLGGFVGSFAIGNYGFAWTMGSQKVDFELGQFLSSRPITSTDLAAANLRSLGKSVLLSWAIWAVSFLVACAVLFAVGRTSEPFAFVNVRWWYFPAMLISWWTTTAVSASIMLTGEKSRLAKLTLVLTCGLVAFLFLADWTLSGDAKLQFFQQAVATCGIGFVVGSAGLFALAHRRRLIRAPTVAICTGIWIVLTAIIYYERHQDGNFPVSMYTFAVGIAALAVVPAAAAPLAIAWNRSR